MNEDTVGVLTAVVAVATLPVGILTGIFVGHVAAGVVFVVGWLLLTPLIPIVGGALVGGDAGSEPERTPVEELRERYARGEIDEAEFERRVARLVETEDVEYDPAAQPAWRRREDREARERGRQEQREFERERE